MFCTLLVSQFLQITWSFICRWCDLGVRQCVCLALIHLYLNQMLFEWRILLSSHPSMSYTVVYQISKYKWSFVLFVHLYDVVWWPVRHRLYVNLNIYWIIQSPSTIGVSVILRAINCHQNRANNIFELTFGFWRAIWFADSVSKRRKFVRGQCSIFYMQFKRIKIWQRTSLIEVDQYWLESRIFVVQCGSYLHTSENWDVVSCLARRDHQDTTSTSEHVTNLRNRTYFQWFEAFVALCKWINFPMFY